MATAITPPQPHRPYPAPAGPWLMQMTWHDLLFAHWRVEASAMRARVPPGLEIEEFGGSAWLGIVPFTMSGVRARWLPPVPGAAAFPELNVRTYVRSTRDGRPGVWFFSLDASSRAAVWGARTVFGLAYMNARMTARRRGEWLEYVSARTGPWNTLAFGPTGAGRAEFRAEYQGAGESRTPGRESLEDFLTGRFCLYAWRRGRLVRGEIDHGPWPLRGGEWRANANTMAAPIGVELRGEPLLHYAERMDVVAWGPRAV
jgi:uncharacterized protein YqjF (DUF2071 family)